MDINEISSSITCHSLKANFRLGLQIIFLHDNIDIKSIPHAHEGDLLSKTCPLNGNVMKLIYKVHDFEQANGTESRSRRLQTN